MSAEVAFALIGVTIGVLVLFTFAAFRYVPMVLGEEGHEDHEESGMAPAESPELPDENLAD